MCEIFNAHDAAPRQLLSTVVGHGRAFQSGKLGPSIFNYTSLRGPRDCADHLRANEQRYCLVDSDEAAAAAGGRASKGSSSSELTAALSFIWPAELESMEQFKPRCGRLCDGLFG